MKLTIPLTSSLCALSFGLLTITSCDKQQSAALTTTETVTEESLSSSVVRVNSTAQKWHTSQPWNKKSATSRNALGAILSGNRVLTTADIAANTTYIELENATRTISLPAQVIAIDYEANLALLKAEGDKAEEFFKDLKPIEISKPLSIGDTLELIQLENNGMTINTSASIQGADIVSSYTAGHYFLTYQAKGSMQSTGNSYTLPALHNGKLAGMLTSYDNDDQLLDILAPEVISAFLADAEDGDYQGFPSLGIGVNFTVDPSFRDWLKLTDEIGGLYVSHVSEESAAEKAGIKKGDVIVKIDNHEIGRRGYYTNKNYGRLYWSHLIRGSHKVNSTIEITILRDAEEQVLSATLTRPVDKLISSNTHDQAPRYLVKGGFIFQELRYEYLHAFGENWENKAPLDLLDVISSPEDYEEGRNKVVLLTATIPTPATTGYESLRNYIITSVNGQTIADIPSLITAFKTADHDGLHTIEIKDGTPETIYLDAATSDQVDKELLQRGIPALSRE